MTPKIQSSLWGHPTFEDLPPKGKLCILWLLTNPRVNLIGVVSFSVRRFEFETGCAIEDLNAAVEAFGESYLSPPEGLMEGSNKGVFIKNFIKFQYSAGGGAFDPLSFLRNNISKAVLSCAANYRESWVWEHFEDAYPELAESLYSKPLASPPQGLTKHKEQEQEQEQEEKREGVGEKKETKKSDKAPTRSRAPKVSQEYSEAFLKFWMAFPPRSGVRNGKKEAWKAWVKNGCEPMVDKIVQSVKALATTDQWQRDDGRYIPMPSTFLNQSRWEDEVVSEGTADPSALGLRSASHVPPTGWQDALKEVAYTEARGDEELENKMAAFASGPWEKVPASLKTPVLRYLQTQGVGA